jgi:regulator of protease activity HflC (stomatin/prohibitin superfamily)
MDHSTILLVGVIIVILYFRSTVNILKEYERGVVFRLGRLMPKAMGPGVVFIFWPI